MKLFNKLVLIFFILAQTISSEEEKHSFSFSASPSLIAGSGFEYVFRSDSRIKSKLDWPLLPAGGLTVNSELKFNTGFYISFVSSFIIPSYSGRMFDYDYLNPDDSSMLTHFSEHKTYIKNGLDLSLNIGLIKPLIIYQKYSNEELKIYCSPSIGIRYIFNLWDALDGYFKYPNDTAAYTPVLPDTPIVPIEGIVIRYKQSFVLPGIGLLFRFELPRYWKIDLSTQLCPNAVGFAEDFHYGRESGGLKFVDVFKKKNLSFYLYISAEKRFSKSFSFFVSGDYTSITAYNGKTSIYLMKTGLLDDVSATGTAGSALHCTRINLGLIFHIK